MSLECPFPSRTAVPLLLAAMLGFGCGTETPAGVGKLPGPSFKLAPSKTTLQQTLVPVEPAVNPENPDAIPAATRAKFGQFSTGPGESFTFRNDLAIAGASDTLGSQARSVVYFPVVTDVHISDTKSPMRLCEADSIGTFQGAYRPQDRYGSQVLDAMVRTLNDFSVKRHYDFFLALGDNIDNTSKDELRWFIGVLDGQVVLPNSGKIVDVVPGPLNDPHDPFQAWGLDKKVPWYTTLGNHDYEVEGTFRVTDQAKAIAIGDTVNLGSEDDQGNIIPDGTKIVADPNRALLGPLGDMQQFFDTKTLPVGHGFTQANLQSGFGDYAFQPNPAVPLKVIDLDLECRNADSADGCLRQDDVDNFLKPQLDDAVQKHELVIIASHQAAEALNPDATEVSSQDFKALLESYPNVVLHLVGHGHNNVVRPEPGTSAAAPGYWEVETSSLIDYPQESRIIEIADNGDGTGEIFATMVNHNSPDGSLTATSRSLSLEDIQDDDNTSGAEGNPEDRNVELAIQIPADVEQALKSAPLPSKIESLTTLEGK